MPRVMSEEPNELRIQDNISGSEIVLYYRMPTTAEAVRYENELIQRRGRKTISRVGETRQKYGPMILEGFREGDFERKVEGRYVPIASDKESPHFDPEWKAHVCKYASDLVGLLARHVFESSAEVEEEEEDEEPIGEDAEKN